MLVQNIFRINKYLQSFVPDAPRNTYSSPSKVIIKIRRSK